MARNKSKQKRRRKKGKRKAKGVPIVSVAWQLHREDRKITISNGDDPDVLKSLQDQAAINVEAKPVKPAGSGR